MTVQEVLELVKGRKSQERIERIISSAAANKQVIRIKYKKKKDGLTKTYIIEPYSYRIRGKKKVLFGYDKKGKKMKMFIVDRLKNASAEKQIFTPRHKVDLSKTAGIDLSKIKKFVSGFGAKAKKSAGKVKESNLLKNIKLHSKTVVGASGFGLAGYGSVQGLVNSIKTPKDEDIRDAISSDKKITAGQVKLIGKAIGLKKELNVVTSVPQLNDQMEKSGYGLIKRTLLALVAADVFEGSNAMYLPSNPNKPEIDRHIIAFAPKTKPVVVAHEIGHAMDYENLGGSKAAQKEYKIGFIDGLVGTFSSKPYERTTRRAEDRAWKNVPKKYRDKKVKDIALSSYDHDEVDSSAKKKILLGGLLAGLAIGRIK